MWFSSPPSGVYIPDLAPCNLSVPLSDGEARVLTIPAKLLYLADARLLRPVYQKARSRI